MANKVQFINDDPTLVLSDLKTKYEALTSRQLQPGQAEVLLLDAFAYRISLMLTQINETANQCFVVFANGAALDRLGELLGVKRLPAAPADTTIRFTLVTGHGALTIPAGIRIQSTDGQAIFMTKQATSVAVGVSTVDVVCECTKDGIIGNGYTAGQVSIILDPQPFVSTASNITTTANGSDDESDDELRERIILATSQFSVAGPKGAYTYWAKSAHPDIVDIAVTIGHDPVTSAIIPGQVDIFPLMANGAAPSTAVIDAINAICNDEKIRPLTDTVVVKAPTILNYSIDVELTILTNAVQQTVENKVLANLNAYVNARKQKLGIDVVLTQLIGQCQVDGVYSVNIVSPVADIVAQPNEYTNCTAINVTTVGTHDA